MHERVMSDRRQSPTPIFSRYSLVGNRKVIRRVEDKDQFVYVDQYSMRVFLFLLLILLMGVADASLTLYHINVNDAKELNPIMDYFIKLSPMFFFNVKYILTAVCLLVLCMHKNLPVVKYLLGAVFIIYSIININHLYLLFFLI